MLKEKEVTKEYMRFLYKRFAGTIFGLAPWLGVWFDKKEVEYIETKIKTDKLYELLGVDNKSVCVVSQYNRLFDFQRVWLQGFLKDPSVPIGVRDFITRYIARVFGIYKQYDEFEGTKRYENSINYDFTAQRWLEKCH